MTNIKQTDLTPGFNQRPPNAIRPSPSSPPPPPRSPQQQPVPPPDPNLVKAERSKAQIEFEESFADFHKNHFLSKVLQENKSAAGKKTEQAAIDRLIKSAMILDQSNVGEGMLALLIVAIREQLSVRDRVNQLEYELCLAQRDVEYMKKELGLSDGQKK